MCLLVAGSLTWQRDCARNEHWKRSAWTLQSGEVCLFLAVMLVFLAVLISSDPQVKLERVLYSDGLKFIRWLHDSECTVTLWFAFKLSSLHSTSEATWAHHGLRSSPWWPSVTWISSVFPHPWLVFYLGPATIHLYNSDSSSLLRKGFKFRYQSILSSLLCYATLHVNRPTQRKYQLSPFSSRPCLTDWMRPQA